MASFTSFVITVINRQHPLTSPSLWGEAARTQEWWLKSRWASVPRWQRPPRLMLAPDDEQFMAPAAPPPPPLSASISLSDPQWGSRCPVPTLPCSLCLHSTAQNLLQIKWIKKDLKVAPTSSVGGWDLLRARAMTIDGQNLLLVAYFGLPPPPLLLLVSLFSTRPCTPKLYIYQKLALWLTFPVQKKGWVRQ